MSEVRQKIRQPRFADNQWYSSSPTELQTIIQGYLTPAPSGPSATGVLGLIAPHAGYFFSGHVAGAAFAGLSPGDFDTVILIGPDHHGAASGVSTPQVDLWRTPLGDIPVNGALLQALQSEFPITLLAHDAEHSLEVELPFLQMSLQQFTLVPLMMGNQSPETCRRLGAALAQAIQSPPLPTGGEGTSDFLPSPSGRGAGGEGWLQRRVLLVASSDLSHYFDDETARQLDQTTLEFILNLDADGLARHVEAGRRRGQPYACGAGPIAAILYAAQELGATQATLRKYATSADAYPQKDRVVGYAAVAIS